MLHLVILKEKCPPIYKEASTKKAYGRIVYSTKNLKTTYLVITTENK